MNVLYWERIATAVCGRTHNDRKLDCLRHTKKPHQYMGLLNSTPEYAFITMCFFVLALPAEKQEKNKPTLLSEPDPKGGPEIAFLQGHKAGLGGKLLHDALP